jgi:hypothetical protein
MLVPLRAEPFRQRFCRAAACGARFFVCRACDRGQCYCSTACRTQARTQQRREARQRQQRSLAGRLNHRDRQRAYRRRLAQRPHQPATPPAAPGQTTPRKRDGSCFSGDAGFRQGVRVWLALACGGAGGTRDARQTHLPLVRARGPLAPALPALGLNV